MAAANPGADRVVVEQDDELTAGLLDGSVDRSEEARVRLVPEQPHMWIGFRELLQVRERVGRGGIVDDENLAAKPGGEGLLECIDARLRVRELFMTRDDDRDGGRLLERGGRSVEARRCAIVRHLEHALPGDARRLGKSRVGGRHDRDHVDASVEVGEFRPPNVNTLHPGNSSPSGSPLFQSRIETSRRRLAFDPFREIRELPTPLPARVGRVEREAGSKLLRVE